MMYATKIKMRPGCSNSQNLIEIDSIYIVDGSRYSGYCKKESLCDYLSENPRTIKVDITPYPFLVPAISSLGEKYVRSESNGYTHDNLLSLPRE